MLFLCAFSPTTDALPVCIQSVVKPAGPEKSRSMASSDPAASTRNRPASTLILPPATIIAPESWPNVDAPPRDPRRGPLNDDARGTLRPSSRPERLKNGHSRILRPHGIVPRLSPSHLRGRRPLWSSTGLRPAALQRLVPSGFFAVAPVGLLRKEKSLRHSALASLGLPAQSLSPPAIAPAASC